jgi:DNA-binding IclR family transcriptional regulator
MSAPPFYPKGDLRRMLVVLAAIAELRPRATVVRIALRTGLDRHTVSGLIDQAIEQAGVKIAKNGSSYRITAWGLVIRRDGAKAALNLPVRIKRRQTG